VKRKGNLLVFITKPHQDLSETPDHDPQILLRFHVLHLPLERSDGVQLLTQGEWHLFCITESRAEILEQYIKVFP
jgi:hypothetical protein